MPAVLRPTNEIAPDVLLPGDPARALALAQDLLTEPRMSNHAHGLWGYSGRTSDGHRLTIQSTGIGAPSAALVLADLAELGARRAVRVGTCAALDGELGLHDPVLCERAIAADGTSRALGANGKTEPDPELAAALAAEPSAPPALTVATTDVIRGPDGGTLPVEVRRRWLAEAAVAVEMQLAALFTLGPRVGVAVAGMLVVADDAEGREGDAEKLDRATAAAGALAAAALRDGGSA
jgi:uridine phosphorylase